VKMNEGSKEDSRKQIYPPPQKSKGQIDSKGFSRYNLIMFSVEKEKRILEPCHKLKAPSGKTKTMLTGFTVKFMYSCNPFTLTTGKL
jgi:hypothetical protein